MQNCENLIAERTKLHGVVKACRIEDPVKRNRHNHDARYDRSPKRIAQHKAWALSPAGKKSMRERGARYRATENGKEHCRKKKAAIIFSAIATTPFGERTAWKYRIHGKPSARLRRFSLEFRSKSRSRSRTPEP